VRYIHFSMTTWINVNLFQVNRPPSMKKDGIQTRKRKPKGSGGSGSKSKSSSGNSSSASTHLTPQPAAGEGERINKTALRVFWQIFYSSRLQFTVKLSGRTDFSSVMA